MSSFGAIAATVVEDDESSSNLRCTYPLSFSRLVTQAIYVCSTCHGQTGKCCCTACAYSCHDGHDVQFMAFGRAYCDCGEEGCSLSLTSVDAARTVLPDGAISIDENGRIEGTKESHLAIHPVQEARLDAQWDLLAAQCRHIVSETKDTFWLSACEMSTPRCYLEEVAASIFQVRPEVQY
jgi:hypothetical protein